MEFLDPGDRLLAALAVEQVSVDGGVGDPHLPLVGLGIEETGGGGFRQEELRRFEPGEELVDLRDGQVCDRVEIVGAVPPLGEVAHIGLAAVAGTGHEPVFRRGEGVERRHAQARGDVVADVFL